MAVDLVEISGSESMIRLSNKHFTLVMHLAGVHEYHTDAQVKVYIPLHKLFIFSLHDLLIKAPMLAF
jgi:glycerol transport system ATP-binding protein